MNGLEWLRELPECMAEAEYRALPEEVARRVEVVHGHIMKCESPTSRHNLIAQIHEFHLDAAESAYRLYAVHRSVLELEHPVRLKLPISELVAG